jgi:hypothetical protein
MTARPDALARRTPSPARRLATHSEIARLARLDRHLVWTMRAGIDVSKTRAARLREIWGANLEVGHLPKFAKKEVGGSIVKGEGRGKDAASWKMILLWTGVVTDEKFRGSGKGGVSDVGLRRDPTPGAGGLEQWSRSVDGCRRAGNSSPIYGWE